MGVTEEAVIRAIGKGTLRTLLRAGLLRLEQNLSAPGRPTTVHLSGAKLLTAKGRLLLKNEKGGTE